MEACTKSRHPMRPLPWIAAGLAFVGTFGCAGDETSPVGPGAPPTLVLSPDEPYSAAGLLGLPKSPDAKAYKLVNPTTSSIPFTVVPDASWVTAAPMAGTVPVGGDAGLTLSLVQAEIDQLSIGEHTASVSVLDAAGGPLLEIEVVLRVDPVSQGYSMNLTPALDIEVTGSQGGPFGPAERTYTWTNVGLAPINFTRSVPAPWVVVTGQESGSIPPQESVELGVRVDTATLTTFSEGTHTTQIRLGSSTSTSQPTHVITVTARVGPSGRAMVLDPAMGFVAEGPQSGPFAPSSRAFTWANIGSSPRHYTRSVTVPWLSVTGPTSGSVNPSQQVHFTVSLNTLAGGLAVGRHFGSVVLNDTQSQTPIEDIGFVVTVNDPGSGANIAQSRSTFTTAPHHAHFSAMNSSFIAGGLEDAKIEWLVETANGAVVDGKVGGSEFGVLFEFPGCYLVTLRVQGVGETAWDERSVVVRVDEPDYAAECWLDPAAATNGTGSPGSPFNDWISAVGFIQQNWTDGPTSEHCIHIKRGTSAIANAAWNSTSRERRGRLVYRAYGTGARPRISYPSGTWVRTGDDNAFAAIDLEVVGDSNPGTSVVVSHKTAGDGSDGHNMILLRCAFRDCGAGLYFNDLGTGNATHVANGEFDFIAVKECTTSNVYQVHTLAPRARYVLFQDNYWNAVQNEYGQRFNHLQHADFRGNEHERANAMAAVFRIHSNLAGADTQWISITDCVFHDETWIGPDAGASHTPYPMRHIWLERCYVDGSGRTWALSAFATERLVIRNCWARGYGSCINHRSDGGTDVARNWIIEGNSLLGEQSSGALGRGWNTSVQNLRDVTFRNNLLHMPNLTRGNSAYFFSVGGNQDATQVFTACDGNQFSAAGGTRNWAANFVQQGSSLSAWRSGTPFGDASSDAAVADFFGPTGPTMDLRIGPSSTAIDAAVPSPGLFVDLFGRQRVSPGDVGAHDRQGVPR